MKRIFIIYILLTMPLLAWCDNITFADEEVKAICVKNWDTNGDGEFSKAEAAVVTDIGTVFQGNTSIKSFDELQYFTSLQMIAYSAFKDCSSLTSITIPNSVIWIKGSAFYGCSNLTSVNIPNSVTSIEPLAFQDCSSLTSIDIPNSVTSIGSWAFYNCSKLTSITIPNSVSSIEDCTFRNCSSLTSIDIPNSVTSIKEHSFNGCSSLTSINIPNSVTSIGYDAFYGCSSLTSVNIPNSVTSIDGGAFSRCSSLTSITIPNSVTSIGVSAFSFCSSLTSVNIPNSIKSIESSTFSRCSSLTSIDIPSTVTSIGVAAFYECFSLTSVNIPNSVTSIGGEAFAFCSSLTSINIPSAVTSIGEFAFTGSGLTSIIYDADIVMPDNIISSGPNLLFYTKDASYAPSKIKNVIVNGTAKEIVLSDAKSGNNFYCPREFTAEKISYTHNYRMTSGLDGQARGWETIALPFTVGEITHKSKGKLLPFGAWTSTSDAKPFWLCNLSSSGFTRATSIQANTPYIICMPNNSDYDSSFNLSGNVTFSATNVKVPVSSSVTTAKSNGKTFIPAFCAQEKASGVYALNVNNSYHSEAGGYTEGSAFVSGLRAVSPFEAYMTTDANNAKRAFLIEFSETTGIDEMPSADNKGGLYKVFNLNGQLVKKVNSQRELDETLKQLPAGVYVVNGKKTVIKR